MYHLPLLPGYDPSVNVRSSVASKSPNGKSFLRRLSEAEENGYEGTYFISEDGEDSFSTDGFIVSSSPFETRTSNEPGEQQQPRRRTRAKSVTDEKIAEVIFFSYGVIVFFGLREPQERAIIEDINTAGILTRKFGEDAWEVEECHFVVSDLYYTHYTRKGLQLHISTTRIQPISEFTTIYSVRLCSPPAS